VSSKHPNFPQIDYFVPCTVGLSATPAAATFTTWGRSINSVYLSECEYR